VIVDWVFKVMTQVDQGLTKINAFDSVISINDANKKPRVSHVVSINSFLTM
jgi:hypothetical protein